MNLVQIKHPGSLQAYVHGFHIQMNGTSKMNKLFKKCIVLGGSSKTGGEYYVQISKAYWGHGGDYQNDQEHWSRWPLKEIGLRLTTKWLQPK